MFEKIKKFIRRHKYKMILIFGIISGTWLYYYYFKNDYKEVKLSVFFRALKLNFITDITLNGNNIFFRVENQNQYKTYIGDLPISFITKIIQKSKVPYSIDQYKSNLEIIPIITQLIPYAFLYHQISKSTFGFNSNKKKIAPIIYKNNQTFDNYYGGQAIKIKLKQVIDFLKNPTKYQKMGARIRRGILFYGPPGTGKTLLARALANEAGCQFIKMVASQFSQVYAGVGPKRVRQLFRKARLCKKGCIIFIDEIDGLGSRMSDQQYNHQNTSTINQILIEIDGFLPNDKIVIVAATNRIDLIDPAILRAGRFDVKINIKLPNQQERVGIFKGILSTRVKKYQFDQEFINYFCKNSQNWCGADIQLLVNQSIYRAIRNKQQIVNSNILRLSLDNLLAKM